MLSDLSRPQGRASLGLGPPKSKRKATSTRDGSTFAASMISETDLSTRSADGIVFATVRYIAGRLGVSRTHPAVLIVESLAWPFVCRESCKQDWFTPKNLGRFQRSLYETAVVLRDLTDDNSREQDFVKYWTNYFVCQVVRNVGVDKTGNEIRQFPPRPTFVTKGLFVSWCRHYVSRAIARKDTSFLYSLQKGSKQMWPELGLNKKIEALEKHRRRFAVPHGECSEELRSFIVATASMFQVQAKSPAKKFMPSGSACLQRNFRSGGHLSLVRPFSFLPRLLGPKEEELPSIVVTNPDGLDTDVTPISWRRPRLGKLFSLQTQLEVWRKTEFTRCYQHVRNQIVASNGQHLRLRCEENPTLPSNGMEYSLVSLGADSSPPDSCHIPYCSLNDLSVMAIPEPGKFRIITKGDGYLYNALQPLQGLMLDTWKANVHSTMKSQDLTEKVREIDFNCGSFRLWCSVDYEAATDLLKKDATLHAFKGCEGLPFYELGLQSLQCGIAEYPAILPGARKVVNLDAQPMGHPLSFPLLCVINLAVYRLAVTKYTQKRIKDSLNGPCPEDDIDKILREQKLMFANVIVNGDDMLFKCDLAFYPFFEDCATDAGLKFSIGKQYLCEDHCMINSQFFSRDKTRGMMRRGYLNLKLVKGVNIKQGDSAANPTQIGKELTTMVDLCPWARSALPCAIKRPEWIRDARKFGFRPNWYLPVHLGGYGIDRRYAPSTLRVTKEQRMMARRFLMEPELGLYATKGMPKSTLKVPQALARWVIVPKAELIGPRTKEQANLSLEVTDDWLAKICYAARASVDCTKEIPALESKPRFIPKRGKDARRNKWKPMSNEEINRYTEVEYLATGLPYCPGFSGFRDVEREHLPPVRNAPF